LKIHEAKMGQPKVFSREQVIDTAFNLIRKNGWGSVSARSIAKELGSSTMPIYSNMNSLEELEQELKGKSRACITEYHSRTYSGEQLLDIAVGYVVFARDEKQLFRFLFIDRPDVTQSEDVQFQQEQFYAQFGKQSTKSRELQVVPENIQKYLIQNSYIFTHGLSMMVNAGIIYPCSNETIISYLQQAGEAFYLLGMSKEEASHE